MCLGITQIQTSDLLDHYCVSVADACLLQVKHVALPRDVGLLREILRIESKAAVAHSVHIEQLVMDDEKFSEVGRPRLEFKIPRFYVLFQAEFLRLDFRECLKHIGAAEDDLAFVADAGAHKQVL